MTKKYDCSIFKVWSIKKILIEISGNLKLPLLLNPKDSFGLKAITKGRIFYQSSIPTARSPRLWTSPLTFRLFRRRLEVTRQVQRVRCVSRPPRLEQTDLPNQRGHYYYFCFYGHSRPLFLYFRLYNIFFNTAVSKKNLPTGFKPRISGVGSDRSTNWATTISTLLFQSTLGKLS